MTCPGCRAGRLVLRRGAGDSTFFGFSHYPYCGHTERACPACGKGLTFREGRMLRCGECGWAVEACPGMRWCAAPAAGAVRSVPRLLELPGLRVDRADSRDVSGNGGRRADVPRSDCLGR